MATINTFDYKQYASSALFNLLLRDVLRKGITKGGKMSKIGDLEVGVNPYVVLIEDTYGSNKILMRIEEDSQKSVNVTEASPYVILTFDYIEVPEEEPTFVTHSQAEVDAGLDENELIFGKANIVGGVIDNTTSFIYDEADYSFLYNSNIANRSYLKSWARIKTGVDITEDSDVINLKYFEDELDEFLDNKTDKLIPFGDGDRFYSHSSDFLWDDTTKRLEITGRIKNTVDPVDDEDIGNRAYNDKRYLSTFSFDEATIPILTRIEHNEQINLSQELRLGYLEGRQYIGSDLFINLFYDNKLSKDLRYLNNEDKTAEIFADVGNIDINSLNLNWYYKEEAKPDFRQGVLKSRRQYHRMEVIDRYTLEGIGQRNKCTITYDNVNECYWMISNNGHSGQYGAGTGIGEITKLSKRLDDGKVEVLGRWILQDLAVSPNTFAYSFWCGITVTLDGEYLFICWTNYDATTNGSGLGKLSINKTSGVHNGTLGLQNKPNGGEIIWTDESVWDTNTSDFNAVEDLERTNNLYYSDLVIWNDTHLAILKSENAGNFDSTEASLGLYFYEIAHNPTTGKLSNVDPRTMLTGFDRYLMFQGGTAEYHFSFSIIKYGNDLWLKANIASTNQRIIYKFNASEDATNFTGDFTGLKVGGDPRVIRSSERHSISTDNIDSYNTYQTKEGIALSHDGHLLEICTGLDATDFTGFISKRALLNSLWAENQVNGELSVQKNAYELPYIEPLNPTACMVEESGNDTFYWTGDTGSTANEVDLYRYNRDTIDYYHARLIGASWTGICDLTTDGTTLWLLGTDGTNYEVYFGSLSNFISAMGTSYNTTANNIDITSWGNIATGIGDVNTDKLYGICYDSDDDILYIINDSDDTIDTLSTDGTTWTQGIISLPAALNSWQGIAYKNNFLYVSEISASTSIPCFIYELEKEKSISNGEMYRTHIYQDNFSYYLEVSGSRCFDFDNNDIIRIHTTKRRFSRQKTLYDENTLQLHSFIDHYNILRHSYVKSHTPINYRFFSPEDYVEDFGTGVFMSSRRNVPDMNYMLVGYNYISAEADQEGFEVLLLDEFLNSEENKTSAGSDRYDIRKIRKWDYQVDYLDKLIRDNTATPTYVCKDLWIDNDVMYVSFTHLGTDVAFWMIDLKTGEAWFMGYSSDVGAYIGQRYGGSLSQRNDSGIDYIGTSTPNEELRFTGSIGNPQVVYARTFKKDDISNYNGDNPVTIIAIGQLDQNAVDVLRVEWNSINNRKTPVKVYNDVFGGGNIGITCGSLWIAPSGYMFACNTTVEDNYYRTSTPVWEINNDIEWDYTLSSGGGVDTIKSGSVEYDTLDIKAPGQETSASHGGYISRNSLCWKDVNGKWRHKLLICGYRLTTGRQVLYWVDPELNLTEKVEDGITDNYGILSCSNFEDITMHVLGNYIGHHNEIKLRKKSTFSDRLRTKTIEDALGMHNWNQVDMGIRVESNPRFAISCRNTSTDGVFPHLYYNPDYGILTMDTEEYGLCMWHYMRYMDECKHESIDIELSKNPQKVHYKETVLISERELLKSLLTIDGDIEYDAGWENAGGLTEIQLENASNIVLTSATFGDPARELRNSDGSALVEGVDYNYDERLDNSGEGVDIYDDNDSGSFDAGKYFRVIENGDNVTDSLGLEVWAKNLSTNIYSPLQSQIFIDPKNGKLLLPRPNYWSKCESIDNVFVSPEISEETPSTDQINTFSVTSGFFNNAIRITPVGSNIEFYPFGESFSPSNTITMSFYLAISTNGQLRIKLNNTGNSYIQIKRNSYEFILVIDGSTEQQTSIDMTGPRHIYIVIDSTAGLGDSKSIRVFCEDTEVLTYSSSFTFDKFFMQIVDATNPDYVDIDNIKIWKEVISEDHSWLYNSGTGRENALHYIYGATNNYIPILDNSSTPDSGVGYFYQTNPNLPAELDEAQAGADAVWTINEGSIRAGIQFVRDIDCGIAYISLYNVTDSVLEIDQEEVDLYQSFEEEFVWWATLDETKEYYITIEHSGTHNSNASANYSIRARKYILVEQLNSSEIETKLVCWHEDHSTEFEHILINEEMTDLVQEKTFNGDDSTRIFSLSGDDRAYYPVQFSEDGGTTWYLTNSEALTWGTNSPDYDNNEVDSDGYFSVNFDTAPEIGTNNVIIRYIPKINKAKIINTLKVPYKDTYKDYRKSPKMLDFGVEFIH